MWLFSLLMLLLYHTHTIPILSTSIQHLTEFVSKNDLISLGSPNPSDVAPGLKKTNLMVIKYSYLLVHN